MKNYLSLFILTVLTIKLFSQDITVSFKTSDAGALIDSVQSINLTTKDSVTITGNETLTLVNNTSGVSFVQDMKGSIFPNPCNGSATLQFATSTDDDATIQIVNASGQLVLKRKQALSAGAHSFSIRFPGSGIYIVLVRTSNEVLSFRVVSTNTEMQNSSLEYSGSTSRIHTEKGGVNNKSATTGKTLNYSTGNNIMYNFYSGNNIRVMVDQPTASKTYDITFYKCTDKDGKNYKTVTIGDQTWIAENLAYNAGNGCWAYNNYESNVATYGRLYTWEVAKAACPSGWHLPTDDEWKQLEMAIGMSQSEADGTSYRGTDEGKKLKATSGWNNNGNATNDYGFSALPGGYRHSNYSFHYVGSYVHWWSATEYNSPYAWFRILYFDHSLVGRYKDDKEDGRSVRCLRD